MESLWQPLIFNNLLHFNFLFFPPLFPALLSLGLAITNMLSVQLGTRGNTEVINIYQQELVGTSL